MARSKSQTEKRDIARPARLREAAGTSIITRDEDANWRPLSIRTGARRNMRDLTPITQMQMQEMACYLWQSNPLANRMIELSVAFLLGEGVQLKGGDDTAQATLDRFWTDPINNMDLNLPKQVRDLSIFGELCQPAFVSNTGRVRLGQLDPRQIANVLVDPDNPAIVIGVEANLANDQRGTYRVIYNAPEAELFSERTRELRATFRLGECFFRRVNDLGTGQRGRSDLLAAIDFLDLYDQLIFGEAERASALRALSWDVEMTGATQEQVEARAKTITPPKPMSVRVHNENEKWNTLTSTLNAADATETLRVVRNHILGSLSIPEHWFGGGGDVNLATASSMGEPTYKIFSQRQKLWKAIIEDIGTYVLRCAAMAQGGSAIATADVTAEFPELTARDVGKYAAALQQIAAATTQATQSGVMSDQMAVTLLATAATQMGVEVDETEELTSARADRDRRGQADMYRDPPPDATTPPLFNVGVNDGEAAI